LSLMRRLLCRELFALLQDTVLFEDSLGEIMEVLNHR
jgi:hypothetical protein